PLIFIITSGEVVCLSIGVGLSAVLAGIFNIGKVVGVTDKPGWEVLPTNGCEARESALTGWMEKDIKRKHNIPASDRKIL
ncbi:MAG: hypothetical protein LWX83_18610, partial [Anaerolineae bacterium]|nr:hypothetical protein [Anaerolineae bacterium]